MNTPIYEALCAARKPGRSEDAAPSASPLAREALAEELTAIALFIDGTRNGVLVPLADFTRHRAAKALRAATTVLSKPAHLGAVDADAGVILIAKERARHIEVEGHRPADDIGRVRELVAAATCYLEVAVWGPEAWVNPDGSYAAPGGWPWSPRHWKPSTHRLRNLVKAGSLIAAAITAERSTS